MSGTGSVVAAGFDSLPARVAILDADGEIVYTNESWDSFGVDQGLAEGAGGVGNNYLAVCDASDDANATEAARGIRAVVSGECAEFSLEYPCHTPEEDGWFMLQVKPYEIEGERFVLAMHVDITDRRLLEQRTAEQAERMESFAKLLSHDLRNPLSVALAHAEMLELDDEIDLSGEGSDRTPLRSSLERMEAIIDDALALVAIETVEETELVPLATVVETAWDNVSTDSATVSVVDDIAIRVNASLVSHLFENLFRNAVEHSSTNPDSHARQNAVEHGSTDPASLAQQDTVEPANGVRVEVGALERDTQNDEGRDSAASGDDHEGAEIDWTADLAAFDGFYVEDDGPGIPADLREQVFESGYSSDDGSGFGLAIVAEVADAHGWSVSVRTGRDGGARFEIRDVSVVEL
ncbi:PAS domain-containing sensor histidine kinase [Natrinema salinisoli]|uniref:PAS domain-containing sensor histidine kinase n=1 Tax=Natrinema salinisoli TaxID=2878535 RepID=UPI001CF01E2D|nr:PAS domain-containing sensor histidine kinase [Natrinema salinisoli]